MADQTGQFMYRTAKATLHRRDNSALFEDGRFELTVSKASRNHIVVPPTRRGSFAEFNASFTDSVVCVCYQRAPPPQLRGLLALRDQFLRGRRIKKRCDTSAGSETFLFRF